MKKKISVGVAIVITLFVALITYQAAYILLSEKYKAALDEVYTYTGTKLQNKIAELESVYGEYYIYDDIDEDAILEAVFDAYVDAIDKYGSYLTAEEYAELMSDYSAKMEGIGVHVIYNADYDCIEVISVMPDSPALDAGLLPGDLIVYVEGKPVKELGYYPAINMIKGKAGTVTNFTVLRGENYTEMIDFSIERAVVTEQTVWHHIITSDPTIGYIKILSFDDGTYEQFVEAVNDLRNSGCTRLVIDVRYNPGGLLTSVVDVLDYILPEGPIVRLIDNKGNVDIKYSDKSYLDMDFVVLVNGSTASAGELFTSAIKDYGLAKIVGTRTYGKGTVQTIKLLKDGDAVSISYKLYSPPYSDNYEGVGITPDIIVELDEALSGISIYKISDEEDNQLQKAISVLNSGD
ncbi:MAG: S41 family peptidase [Eubacteriales bacterium]|jgi:carboxyl-terminal processing protease|nr:S41 family peptidase [Clostridiales bacterium]